MKIFWLALAALALAAPFFHYSLGWLAFFSLVPLLAMMSSDRFAEWSNRRFVLAVWAVGFVAYLLITFWLVQNKPSEWAAIGGWPVLAAHMVAWLWFSLALSVVVLGFALAAIRFRGHRLFSPGALAVLPAAWAVAEYVRSWLTSAVVWGPGATLGAHWDLGSLGFAAATTPFGLAARLIGLHGLSALAVLISICLLWLWRRRRSGLALAGLAGAVLLAVIGWVGIRGGESPAIRAGVLHVQPETALVPETIAQYEATTPQPAPFTLLALPEYSELFGTDTSETDRAILALAFRGQPGVVVGSGAREIGGEQRVGQITYRDQAGQVLATQEKNFLVPAGEYLPAALEGVIRASGSALLVPQYTSARGLQRGRMPEQPVTVNGVTYGTLACSGVMAPDLYRRLSAGGAEVLINNASLSLLKDAPQFSQQNRQMARFTAVAGAKPLVQASRAGSSFVIDRDGRFRLETTASLFIGATEIRPSQAQTLYNQLGEWVVFISALVLLGFTVQKRKKLPFRSFFRR